MRTAPYRQSTKPAVALDQQTSRASKFSVNRHQSEKSFALERRLTRRIGPELEIDRKKPLEISLYQRAEIIHGDAAKSCQTGISRFDIPRMVDRLAVGRRWQLVSAPRLGKR